MACSDKKIFEAKEKSLLESVNLQKQFICEQPTLFRRNGGDNNFIDTNELVYLRRALSDAKFSLTILKNNVRDKQDMIYSQQMEIKGMNDFIDQLQLSLSTHRCR